MSTRKIGVFVGSLRKDSFSKKLAAALQELAPDSFELLEVAIGDLPFYNQDLDDASTPPASWTALREQVKGLDAVLFVTPEYNRSVPAALKNALDIASRPYVSNTWSRKPGAVISISQGGIGGFGANHHLRQSLACLNVPTLQQPEAYIGNIASLFNDEGVLANEDTREFLRKFLRSFAAWIEANSPRKQ